MIQTIVWSHETKWEIIKIIKPRDIFSSNFKNSTEVVKFLENIETHYQESMK